MPGKKDQPRKRRTRGHMIAALAVNHVERQALLFGFTVQRIEHDYGIDLNLTTYDRRGQVEGGRILLQVKATDQLQVLSGGELIAFRVETADLRLWLGEPMPVILVVYDPANEVAYWLYVQAYFASRLDFDLAHAGKTVTLRIPRRNVLDQSAMKRFAGFRDAILAQVTKVIHHE